MSGKEQARPLAPPITSLARFNSCEDYEAFSSMQHQKPPRIRKCIQCCGCVTALFLILVVTIIILGFTVFTVKEPRVRLNGVTLLNGTLFNGVRGNITLFADLSVKNPNVYTFRFGNTITTVYYGGIEIGDGTTLPGKAKARRTLRFNVTMEIMAKRLLGIPGLRSDISTEQALNISSYTRIDGKVKILNLFKKKVVVKINCTVEYNITTGLTSNGDNCLRRVEI